MKMKINQKDPMKVLAKIMMTFDGAGPKENWNEFRTSVVIAVWLEFTSMYIHRLMVTTAQIALIGFYHATFCMLIGQKTIAIIMMLVVVLWTNRAVRINRNFQRRRNDRDLNRIMDQIDDCDLTCPSNFHTLSAAISHVMNQTLVLRTDDYFSQSEKKFIEHCETLAEGSWA